MKLRIFSDLHLEHGDFDVPAADGDAVVLAGDIHTGFRGLGWARRNFPGTPVLYVPGNHEYYGQAIPRLTNKLRERAQGTNVHIMDRGRVELDGVTFLGATLWTDFALRGKGTAAKLVAGLAMNDYRRIRVSPGFSRLSPGFAQSEHETSRRWLQDELEQGDGPVCVITHHAPSAASLAEQFRDDELSPAYASDLPLELVGHPRIRLWVHGHVHTPSDYTVGGTRVVCNPRGYAPNDLVPGFDPELVIDCA